MKKRKRIVTSLMIASYLTNQSINVFAEERKNVDISTNIVQAKETSDINVKSSSLAEVYLDGFKESSGSGADADNPVNSFNAALDLVSNYGTIYVTGEVSIPDDVHIPNKVIFIKQQEGKSKGKLKFEKKLYLSRLLYIKNIEMEFLSSDKDCIFLNGSYLEISNTSIIGKPNIFIGSENENLGADKTGSLNIMNNNLNDSVIGNIILGGKNGHTVETSALNVRGVTVEGTVDGENVKENSSVNIEGLSSINKLDNIKKVTINSDVILNTESGLDKVLELYVDGGIKIKNGSKINSEYIYGNFTLDIEVPDNETLIEGNYIKSKRFVGEIYLNDELIRAGYREKIVHAGDSIFFALFNPQTSDISTNYEPTIKNLRDIIIIQGDTIDLKKGVEAWDFEDGNITDEIVFPNIDLRQLPIGRHELIYEVTDRDKNRTTMNRVIYVIANAAPLINGADNITIKVGQVEGFNLLAGITVTDDKDIIDPSQIKVIGVLGKPEAGKDKDYTITYEITDTNGNTTKVDRIITVTNQLPIIEGLNDITIKKGENADLKKGITAKDNEDGILTDKIVFPDINLSTLTEGKHQVIYKVTDSDGNSISKKRIINVNKNNSSEDKPTYPASKPFTSLRLGGSDRYNAAVEIAKKFQNGKMLDNVVIANGLNFPDALTGSALTSSLNASILLTYTNYMPKSTIEYIKGNLKKEGTIYLLGSTGVVPDSCISELKAAGFTKFVRLGGSDRYDTNLEIVNKMNVKEGTPIFVANSTSFADSLSASPISAAKGMPIFLSLKDYMPEKIMKAIKKIKPSKIYIIGSNGVISDGLANQLSKVAPVTRLGGADRYDTCLAINKHFNLDTENAIIASGLDFPDALTGSVLAAKLNAPVILLPSWVGERQKTYIDSTRMRNLYVLGGNGLITDTMINELKK